jgi:predicted nucleotidyltransferase
MKHYAPDFGRSFGEARGAFNTAEVKMFTDLLEQMKSIYGKKLLSVKLVGSRARATATDSSDYDFLIFLESCDYDIEVPRLKVVCDQLSSKHGLGPLSLSPMSPEQYHGLDAKFEGITGRFLRDAINLWP